MTHTRAGGALRAGAAALLALGALAASVRASEPRRAAYDWGVAYYMPYDNDLARGYAPIIKMIREGLSSPRTVAAVQADLPGPGGMRRVVITPAGAREERIASDDSADVEQLCAYLEWFTRTFRCRHYVVVLMNHGGGVDEMCRDDSPQTRGMNWMSGSALGVKLRALKRKMPGKWDLLFLQQCGRASIENLYSFRGTADYVLSSPVRIGAPNTYYSGLHRWLGKTPDATGDRVAERIARLDDHYYVYSCAKGAELERLPERLGTMLKPLLARKRLMRPAAPAAIYECEVGKAPLVDARIYFERLAEANGAGRDEVGAFMKWVNGSLLTGVFRQARNAAKHKDLCGLGLYVPATRWDVEDCTDPEVYTKTRLAALWRALIPLPRSAGR